MGETVVEGQIDREGGRGEPVGGAPRGGSRSGDHRPRVGTARRPGVSRGSRDAQEAVGGKDGREGLNVSAFGAVDVGPGALGLTRRKAYEVNSDAHCCQF